MDDHLMSRHADHARDAQSSAAANKPRACANCARLKMKCQWPAAGTDRSENTCSRCARMKLPCHVPELSQRKKRGKSTRVAQLEKKIDGIVSLLAANQRIAPTKNSPLTPESSDLTQANRQTGLSAETSPEDGARPIDVSADLASLEIFPGFRLTPEQAESYLKMYRQDLMPRYPFVIIPETKDAFTLLNESRCLFWAVMASVAPQSSAVQREFKKWFRQYIAEHVVVRQEKRLDLLQAILIHLGWGDFHFYFDLQATNFLQLAMALVVDLRLDRDPDSIWGTPRTLLGDAWSRANDKTASGSQKTSHNLEEKRAVLGFYHITSLVNTLFRRVPQLQWNSYLTKVCNSLSANRQCSSDRYIAALIQMERAADRAHSVLPSAEFVNEETIVFRSTHDMAIKALRKEIDNVYNAQPDEIKKNHVFCSYYKVLLMRLYEPVLSMRAPYVSDADTFSAEPFQRSEALWKCLEISTDYFEAQLSIPGEEIPFLPFTSTGILAFAIITTSRLMLLESSNDWESDFARRKFDFGDVMKRMSKQFEEGEKHSEALGRRQRLLDDGTSVFYKYVFKLRWIRQWYLARVPQTQAPPTDLQPFSMPEPGEGLGEMVDFNFDEQFWQELMSVHDPNLLSIPAHGPLQHNI